ncbi:hypothetical protein Mapa_002838 [Marchantia paleacea]|nr:hypothetical protein Mapa_002838 [Marchantia paleacea]
MEPEEFVVECLHTQIKPKHVGSLILEKEGPGRVISSSCAMTSCPRAYVSDNKTMDVNE